MNVTIRSSSNYVTCSIPLRSSLPELNKWMDFVQEVLRYASDGKVVYLFTLSPQKYSLGYELGSFEESRVGKEKVLINHFEKLTDPLLLEIINSEEFNRGLLKVILSDGQRTFNDLDFVQGNYANVKDELITLEDDGSSFYWYNPHLPKDQIEQRLNELKLASVNS